MSNFFAIPITDEWGTTYQLTTAGSVSYTHLPIFIGYIVLVHILTDIPKMHLHRLADVHLD